MKKLFFISIVCVAFHFTSYAQSARLGFNAGVAIANYDSKTGSETTTAKSKTGFTAGILVDVPMGTHFSFQPAVNFVQKGTKDDTTIDGVIYNAQMNVNNIEVPLNFLYNTRGSSGDFFAGLGPSFTYALSGTSKVTGGGNSASTDLHFGSGANDDMKTIDFGANFTAGYCFKGGLLLSANYNAGLSNLLPQASGGDKLSSHYFGIKLGYLLKGSSKK